MSHIRSGLRNSTLIEKMSDAQKGFGGAPSEKWDGFWRWWGSVRQISRCGNGRESATREPCNHGCDRQRVSLPHTHTSSLLFTTRVGAQHVAVRQHFAQEKNSNIDTNFRTLVRLSRNLKSTTNLHVATDMSFISELRVVALQIAQSHGYPSFKGQYRVKISRLVFNQNYQLITVKGYPAGNELCHQVWNHDY